MQVELKSPCEISASYLTPLQGGSFCSSCEKTVVDYSNMTDSEMKDYITKFGLGCGSFRADQLNRELAPAIRHKNRFLYLPILAALFVPPKQSVAQVKQSTEQTDTSSCKKEDHEILDTIESVAYGTTVRLFGTGNVTTTRTYTQIPFTPIYILDFKWWRRIRRHTPAVRFIFKAWYIPFVGKVIK